MEKTCYRPHFLKARILMVKKAVLLGCLKRFLCNGLWSSTIKVVSIWSCTNRSVWVINSRTALFSDVTRRQCYCCMQPAGWPFLAGFNTTFGITSKKFEQMGISINSLRRRANPVCLCIVKKEEAMAYETMYSSMEGGLFELVHNTKLCKQSNQCEICDAVREQIEQGPMRDLLTPPKPKMNKNKRGEKVLFKFEIPLKKPMCDNTTKFSKWIKKKNRTSRIKFYNVLHTLPALLGRRDRIQRFLTTRRHTRSSYKLLVCCLRCSNTALGTILQYKIVEWLRTRNEPRAAE
jgi:hypothetical protein